MTQVISRAMTRIKSHDHTTESRALCTLGFADVSSPHASPGPRRSTKRRSRQYIFGEHRTNQLLRYMSTTDTTLQSDIGKMKTEPDGSFKRLDSSFRNTIEKGGKFEPATGRHRVKFFNFPLRFYPDRDHLYVSYACREYPRAFSRKLSQEFNTLLVII
jgi:hypothetical protein